jgi:hypothetical protein
LEWNNSFISCKKANGIRDDHFHLTCKADQLLQSVTRESVKAGKASFTYIFLTSDAYITFSASIVPVLISSPQTEPLNVKIGQESRKKVSKQSKHTVNNAASFLFSSFRGAPTQEIEVMHE